jgi:hypothetical protein
MFRPSRNLLFRPIPALNKLKIHQPLPLSPRESAQLLNILTTSFRQHLDAEHPKFFPGSENAAPRPFLQSFTTTRRQRSSLDPAHPADRHLHSLLTNPLFNLSPRTKVATSVSNPMDIFNQAVAKGIMDLGYAHACLSKVKRGIIESSVLNVRDGMKDSGAGLKVLKWLISSGTTNDNQFLKYERFTGLLMEFMVAEGLQEVAWVWIKRGLEDSPDLCLLYGEARKEARRDAVRPLMVLAKAEVTGSVGLNAAYLCLSRAAGYLKGRSALRMKPYLGPLMWFLVNETVFHNHQPSSESNFESFLGLIPGLSKNVDYLFAHLNVLHPTKPSAELALDFLRKLDMDSTPESIQKLKDLEKTGHCRYQIKLILDTAKLLLETNRFADADWVMEFARTHYPKQLGVEEKRQLEQARAEALSLGLLEGLSLA